MQFPLSDCADQGHIPPPLPPANPFVLSNAFSVEFKHRKPKHNI